MEAQTIGKSMGPGCMHAWTWEERNNPREPRARFNGAGRSNFSRGYFKMEMKRRFSEHMVIIMLLGLRDFCVTPSIVRRREY